jgi:hypothetical protein
VKIDVAPETERAQSPSLILQPLVENSNGAVSFELDSHIGPGRCESSDLGRQVES